MVLLIFTSASTHLKEQKIEHDQTILKPVATDFETGRNGTYAFLGLAGSVLVQVIAWATIGQKAIIQTNVDLLSNL